MSNTQTHDSARLASVITEHNIAEGYSIEDFAKASAVGLYLSAGLEDLPDVVTYDRIQEDPETLRDCAVWEVFEDLEHGTIAGLLADQYTQNLSDYQLCFDAGRKAAQAKATALVQQLTAIIVEELLPAAARIAVQDFRRLNETLIASSKFLAETAPTKE